jgi:hypothetical protein
MAGSSMPLTPRVPPMRVPLGAEVEEIVVVAHGGLESYGFHALEIAQCLAERRRGGETGVTSVQCFTGAAFWEALRSGQHWSAELEAAALSVADHGPGTPLDHYASQFSGNSTAGSAGASSAATAGASGAGASGHSSGTAGGPPQRETNEPAIFLVEYRDGLRVSVLMLNGYVTQRAAAVRIKGEPTPLAAWFTQARRQPLWHFCHQVDYIERMVESGQAPFPVERTLLTTGLVDAVMTSRYESNRRLETPYLAVAYQPPPEPAHHLRSATVPTAARA